MLKQRRENKFRDLRLSGKLLKTIELRNSKHETKPETPFHEMNDCKKSNNAFSLINVSELSFLKPLATPIGPQTKKRL